MRTPEELLASNRAWAAGVKDKDPDFFSKLSEQQSPKYLWIGCADSRVPANQIVGLMPGEIFVHRNVGNVVYGKDINCMSVVQYAVNVLKVKHIILCGHYGCGGVQAALSNMKLGLIDQWLQHIKDILEKHKLETSNIRDDQELLNRSCELNVIEQVNNLCHTSIIQDAWKAGQELSIRGWIYGISNGLIKDLKVCISSKDEITSATRESLAANR